MCVCVQCGHIADKVGSSDAKSAFWLHKSSDFSKFMVCPHGQGGREVEPMRTFCGQRGRGIIFSRFCADIFYGGP